MARFLVIFLSAFLAMNSLAEASCSGCTNTYNGCIGGCDGDSQQINFCLGKCYKLYEACKEEVSIMPFSRPLYLPRLEPLQVMHEEGDGLRATVVAWHAQHHHSSRDVGHEPAPDKLLSGLRL